MAVPGLDIRKVKWQVGTTAPHTASDALLSPALRAKKTLMLAVSPGHACSTGTDDKGNLEL